MEDRTSTPTLPAPLGDAPGAVPSSTADAGRIVTVPNLIERLRGVSLGGSRLSSTDANYLNGHIVPDVPQDVSSVKIIFLVESPHKDEVRPENKYPLAGRSGRNVTKDLIHAHNLFPLDDSNQCTSIGKLVSRNCIPPWLSIMNISLLPLQKTAYCNTENQSIEIRTLWCALEEIKSKLEKSDIGNPDLCPTSHDVYEAIVHDLARRIEQITSITQCQPKLIPFGNMARRSLDRVKQIRPCLNELPVSDVPVRHPSAWYFPPYENRCIDLACVAVGIRGYLPRAPYQISPSTELRNGTVTG